MDDFITEEALNGFINDYCKEQYAYWKNTLEKDIKLLMYAEDLYDPEDEMLQRLKEAVKNDIKELEIVKNDIKNYRQK